MQRLARPVDARRRHPGRPGRDVAEEGSDPKNALVGQYQRLFEGRSVEKRLSLLKDINERASSAAKLSPDDLVITIYEAPGENFSFGRGGAQRANAVRGS